MIYYKVKERFDGIVKNGLTLIENELLTVKQVEKHKVPVWYTTKIGLSSKKTYMVFGVRFERGL
jgi:hypothetical protein